MFSSIRIDSIAKDTWDNIFSYNFVFKSIYYAYCIPPVLWTMCSQAYQVQQY